MRPCEHCGSTAPTKKVFFMRHIGLILLFFHSNVEGVLCRRCIDRAFISTFFPTLLLGWWGIISFLATCVILPVDLIVWLTCLGLPKVDDAPRVQTWNGEYLPPAAATPNVHSVSSPGPAFGVPVPTPAPADAYYQPSVMPSPAAQTPKKKSRAWLIALVVAAPIALCCVSGGALVGWAGFESSRLHDLAHACGGRGVAESPAYTATPGVHRAVALAWDGNAWQVDYDLIPDAWSTSHADEAELVVCLGEERETVVERCEYMTPTGVTTIERIGYTRDARVVIAGTGRELASQTLSGAAPGACSDDEMFYGAATSTSRRGEPVGVSEVETFVRAFVTGAPAPAPPTTSLTSAL